MVTLHEIIDNKINVFIATENIDKYNKTLAIIENKGEGKLKTFCLGGFNDIATRNHNTTTIGIAIFLRNGCILNVTDVVYEKEHDIISECGLGYDLILSSINFISDNR